MNKVVKHKKDSHDFDAPKRWGRALLSISDRPVSESCAKGKYLYRKHLVRKDGVCRRCGFLMPRGPAEEVFDGL